MFYTIKNRKLKLIVLTTVCFTELHFGHVQYLYKIISDHGEEKD